MFLVVGLGNPGQEYEKTRHNLGFMVLDELAARCNVKTFKTKHRALLEKSTLDGKDVLLAKPQTFMNNSGEAVREIASWYKVAPEKIVVIYDDVDLEPGTLRLRTGGGAGGHHGVESVMNGLGHQDFVRVRVGIGRENFLGDVTKYVLENIPPGQKEIMKEAIISAADAVEEIIKTGVSSAMNKFNR